MWAELSLYYILRAVVNLIQPRRYLAMLVKAVFGVGVVWAQRALCTLAVLDSTHERTSCTGHRVGAAAALPPGAGAGGGGLGTSGDREHGRVHAPARTAGRLLAS